MYLRLARELGGEAHEARAQEGRSAAQHEVGLGLSQHSENAHAERIRFLRAVPLFDPLTDIVLDHLAVPSGQRIVQRVGARRVLAVDGGAALQEYLENEHIECQNAKDGSTLLPEAMRARARVPRCAPLPVPRTVPPIVPRSTPRGRTRPTHTIIIRVIINY